MQMAKIIIKGRGVIAGIVEGEALVCPKSITGWAGIDPETGIIKEHGNINKGNPSNKKSWCCRAAKALTVGRVISERRSWPEQRP